MDDRNASEVEHHHQQNENLSEPPVDYHPKPVRIYPPPQFPIHQSQTYTTIDPYRFPAPTSSYPMKVSRPTTPFSSPLPLNTISSSFPQTPVSVSHQPWKTHLFDCMQNPKNAIITLFFPCITFGQIAEILDNGSPSCARSGILYSLMAYCIGIRWIMSYGYRSKLRAKVGVVDESSAPDWVIHCFCDYCALCQEFRELKARGFDPSIGYLGNMAKQQQNIEMKPPMQQRMMI